MSLAARRRLLQVSICKPGPTNFEATPLVSDHGLVRHQYLCCQCCATDSRETNRVSVVSKLTQAVGLVSGSTLYVVYSTLPTNTFAIFHTAAPAHTYIPLEHSSPLRQAVASSRQSRVRTWRAAAMGAAGDLHDYLFKASVELIDLGSAADGPAGPHWLGRPRGTAPHLGLVVSGASRVQPAEAPV